MTNEEIVEAVARAMATHADVTRGPHYFSAHARVALETARPLIRAQLLAEMKKWEGPEYQTFRNEDLDAFTAEQEGK